MITAVILTKNEEDNIVDCLDTVMFCDQIIVIDDFSDDKTAEIVKSKQKEHPKLELFKRKLDGNFSAQRNYGIQKSSNDWILFVDADERIPKELASEIKENITPSTKYGGFLLRRTDFMWGKELKHGDVGNAKLLRLFNRKKGQLKGTVHEKWVTDSEVGLLVSPILHYPHQSISEFLREINFYTDLRAKELYDQGKKSGFISIILYTKGKFFMDYFIKLGILDGVPGIVHATLMSFHSFLVRGKLWLLWQKN